MIIFGCLSLLLCVFLLGLFWPHEEVHDVGTTIWGYFVKSLYFAWIWFTLSYYTDIGQAARPISVLMVILLGLVMMHRPVMKATIPADLSLVKTNMRIWIAISAFLCLTYPAWQNMGSIFTAWDAVASWNRWAIGLFSNQYAVPNAAYPILWPGIWSLIYEAQGTSSIWIVAKASIAAPLIFCAIYASTKVLGPKPISGVILVLLILSLFVTQTEHIVSGYMDLPLDLLGMTGLLLILAAIDSEQLSKRKDLLLLASITFAVSMVTKQGGLVFSALFGVVCLNEWRNKRLSFWNGVFYLFVLLVPIIIYIWIYIEDQSNPFSSYSVLQNVTDKARGESDKMSRALEVLGNSVSNFALLILFIGVALNFLQFRQLRGVFGLTCTSIAVVLFLVFSDCCTYNARNGWITFSFLIVSSYIGYSGLEKSIYRYASNDTSNSSISLKQINLSRYLRYMIAVLSVVILSLQLEYPNSTLVDRQLRKQSVDLTGPFIHMFLTRNKQNLDAAPIIVSYNQMLKYVPSVGSKYYMCHQTTVACLDGAMKVNNPDHVLVFTMGWNENDTTRTLLRQLVEYNVAITADELQQGSQTGTLLRVNRDAYLSWRSNTQNQ